MKKLLTLLLLSPLAFAEDCISGNCVNGQGIFTYTDGRKYEGEFKDNKFNGQGTYTFADGGKFEGEYKDGLRNGQGTYTYANGRQKIGKWKNDEYQIVMSAADCYEHRYRQVDRLKQIYNATMEQLGSSYTPRHIIENITNKYLQDVGRADEEYEECKKR